jgi:predicted restriction endonuclease
MCSTHEEKCRDCGIKLAWWSMFDNIQSEDEYHCQGVTNKNGKLLSSNYKKLTDEEYNSLCRKEDKKVTLCKVEHNTTFCKKCAKKLDYRCPVCGGEITLSRKA